VPQKNRGLLKVPSRSSSRNQPSPTSTKLSGATAADRSESIGGGSRESKASSLGRKRNGSTASSKMSITQTGAAAGPTANTSPTTSSPTSKPKAKKQSFFSKLCCGIPDSANTLDAGEHPIPANKVTKITGDRPATASKPVQNSTTQQPATTSQPQTEKDALKQEDDATTKATSQEIEPEPKEKVETEGNASTDQITSTSEKPVSEVNQGQSSTQGEQSRPSVIVQPPTKSEPTSSSAPEVPPLQKDHDGDVQMQNNEPVKQQEAVVPVARNPEPVTTTTKATLPPPPPPPVPEPQLIPDPAQKWLLPPIAPRFKGKKCLVLDLDETLVHSSFKVSLSFDHALTSADNAKILHQADFTIPVEIEGQYHNVYVIKRPGVDQFMKRVGELYEVVVFTASVSKVESPSRYCKCSIY